ncbi:MAG: hypothetical protein JSV86_13275 [Gemmatimonadota bacterium]|nr:MAG: hypothetical protein JSV86_13275 [Gemmatimonadota bacterium]
MTRLVLAITLVLVAGGLLLAAFQMEEGRRSSELTMGLAIEVFGIIVTLAVVDWMLERRRRQERARDLAWATLHSVERAVWVWQGGPRRVTSDELLGLILGIDTNDALQPFTRSLLAAVGARSLEILDREASSLGTVPGLASALQELSGLNSLSNERSSVSIVLVRELLHCGIQGLTRVLGLSSRAMLSAFIRYQDAAADAQRERYERLRSGLSEIGGQTEVTGYW